MTRLRRDNFRREDGESIGKETNRSKQVLISFILRDEEEEEEEEEEIHLDAIDALIERAAFEHDKRTT